METDYAQYYKKYVQVQYTNDKNQQRSWEGCLYAHDKKFIYVAGKYAMPIPKDKITSIEITRE